MFDQKCEKHFQNGPQMHPWLQEMHREAIDKHGDVMLVGELANSDAEKTLEYVSTESNELSMVFDGAVVDAQRLDRPLQDVPKPQLSIVKQGFQKQQDFLKRAWATALLAILSGSLSGTLFIYQGQEIGMTNMPETWGESHLRDPGDLNKLREIEKKYPNDREWYDKVLGGIRRMGRDNARMPVQWTGGETAGFTTGKPWMDVQGNQDAVNIKDQENDPTSIFSTWKKLLKVRKDYQDVLVFGSFEVDDMSDEKVFTYIKDYHGEQTALVVLNWTAEEQNSRYLRSCGDEHSSCLIANEPEESLRTDI
ncbi:hypothetical protein MRB53_039179 [Persea americana]|nr:hypothetical protein MRB53_039179 [Persea americana]